MMSSQTDYLDEHLVPVVVDQAGTSDGLNPEQDCPPVQQANVLFILIWFAIFFVLLRVHSEDD